MNEITTYHGVTLSAWDERGEEVSKEAEASRSIAARDSN
jgi:hypothetical protein